MAGLIDAIQQLTTPNQDLGGAGINPDELAKLIMTGGSASVGGQQLFGQPSAQALEVAATQARMGGFGRKPDQQLASDIAAGRVNPADVLDRPISPRTRVELQRTGPNIETQVRVPIEEQIARHPDGTFLPAGGANPSAVLPLGQPTGRFGRVLDTADQIATSLGSKNVSGNPVTRTLLPNPYGPGSYDPNNPQDVERVQAQGAEAQKIQKARDLLSSDFLTKLPPGSPVKDIVAGVLESAGVIKSDAQKAKEIAQAKAEGERAGGKGAALNPELVKSAGTDKFNDLMLKEVGKGTIDAQRQIQLQNIHDKKLRDSTVGDLDRRALVSIEGSVDSLQRIEDAYKETTAYKTGTVTDTLKQALALTVKGASAIELSGVMEKLSPADRKYVALANTFRLNLRRVSEDSRFSNFDAEQVLQAIGNPLVGRDLYLEQLGASKNELTSRHDNLIDGLANQGRRVGNFKKIRGDSGSSNQAAARQGILPNGKRWREVDGKVQIEE